MREDMRETTGGSEAVRDKRIVWMTHETFVTACAMHDEQGCTPAEIARLMGVAEMRVRKLFIKFGRHSTGARSCGGDTRAVFDTVDYKKARFRLEHPMVAECLVPAKEWAKDPDTGIADLIAHYDPCN